MRGILAREGGRGLFAGYGSFLLRDLPFDAIEFVAYEQLKKAYRVRRRSVTGAGQAYPCNSCARSSWVFPDRPRCRITRQAG